VCKTRAVKRIAVLALLPAVFAASAFAASTATPLGSSFKATIKGAPAPLSGTWRLAFAANGAYAVSKKPSAAQLIAGAATVSGHTIVFHDHTGPLACTGSAARGTYSWALSGSKLKLTVVKDTCQGRPLILAGAAFTKLG
jgi:hypothetical protein